jgi:hypothetical protein
VAKVARPITLVMALLLFVALALTAASELGAEGPATATTGLAGAPLDGDAPHDCHQLPLHGARYVAATPSAQPRQTSLTSSDGANSALGAVPWQAGARLATAQGPGPDGRDLRARCSPRVLQVFRT